jgi:hypothetical protein
MMSCCRTRCLAQLPLVGDRPAASTSGFDLRPDQAESVTLGEGSVAAAAVRLAAARADSQVSGAGTTECAGSGQRRRGSRWSGG